MCLYRHILPLHVCVQACRCLVAKLSQITYSFALMFSSCSCCLTVLSALRPFLLAGLSSFRCRSIHASDLQSPGRIFVEGKVGSFLASLSVGLSLSLSVSVAVSVCVSPMCFILPVVSVSGLTIVGEADCQWLSCIDTGASDQLQG